MIKTNRMKDMLTDGVAVVAVFVICAAVLTMIFIAVNWLLWWAYNGTLHHSFHWPYLSKWQIFGICVVGSAVGNWFKATVSTKEK